MVETDANEKDITISSALKNGKGIVPLAICF